jgi:hypothetical protein
MLIQIIDNIRYLNLHVLWLKVEWIDLTFMPYKCFGTSLKRQLFGRYYLFDNIVVCPLSHQTRLDLMDHDDLLRTCRCFFSLCDRYSSYLVGSHREKRQNNVWIYVFSCRSWGASWGLRVLFFLVPSSRRLRNVTVGSRHFHEPIKTKARMNESSESVAAFSNLDEPTTPKKEWRFLCTERRR